MRTAEEVGLVQVMDRGDGQEQNLANCRSAYAGVIPRNAFRVWRRPASLVGVLETVGYAYKAGRAETAGSSGVTRTLAGRMTV